MLAIFKTNASRGLTNSHVIECIKAVESWSNGTFCMTPAEDPLDIPIVPFEVHPPEKDTRAPSAVNLHEDESDSDSASLAPQLHLPARNADSENDDTASIVSVDPDYQGRPLRRRGYPTSCRGVTWLINTEGCRRAVLLTLFDDVGYTPSQYSISNSSVPTSCDSHLATFRDCHDDNDTIQSLVRLLPPDKVATKSTSIASEYNSNSNVDEQPVWQRQHNITRLQRLQVRQALQELRLQIWKEAAGGSQFIPYTPHKFLPDAYIERIVSMAGSLTTVEDLQLALAKPLQLSSLLVPFVPQLFETATKAYTDCTLPSRPVALPLTSRASAQPPRMIP